MEHNQRYIMFVNKKNMAEFGSILLIISIGPRITGALICDGQRSVCDKSGFRWSRIEHISCHTENLMLIYQQSIIVDIPLTEEVGARNFY